MRIITFKLPDSLLAELDRYALKHGMSRTGVIREAIRYYLTHNHEPRKHRFTIKRVILDPPEQQSEQLSSNGWHDCSKLRQLRSEGMSWYAIGRKYATAYGWVKKWYLRNCTT